MLDSNDADAVLNARLHLLQAATTGGKLLACFSIVARCKGVQKIQFTCWCCAMRHRRHLRFILHCIAVVRCCIAHQHVSQPSTTRKLFTLGIRDLKMGLAGALAGALATGESF
jgi:hypothetical protein